jgi:hypothetical protein
MDMYPLAGTSTNAKLWLLKTSKAALYIAETYCVTQQIFGYRLGENWFVTDAFHTDEKPLQD